MAANRAIGATTFPNTIEGMGATEESVGSQRNVQGIQRREGDSNAPDQNGLNGTKLNSIMNTGTQGSVENLAIKNDFNVTA